MLDLTYLQVLALCLFSMYTNNVFGEISFLLRGEFFIAGSDSAFIRV